MLKKIFKIPQFLDKYGLSFLALEELRRFGNWVNDGKLYANLVEHFNAKKLTEAQAKKVAFGLFFSQNSRINKQGREWIPFKKQKELFAEVFPFVSEIIRILKIRNHKDLSVYLQRVESYIFIDCIARELVEEGIIPLTIHDSIVVETRYEQQAVEIMQRVFMQHFNALPTLKVTYLGTGNRSTRGAEENGSESPKMRPAKFIREHVAAHGGMVSQPQLKEIA